MNKENAALYLPLVQALSEGKVIQNKLSDGQWDDMGGEIIFCDPSERYRVKPEPRRFWIVEYENRTQQVWHNGSVSVGDECGKGKVISVTPVIEILHSKETP